MASANEQLLFAAKTDSGEILEKVLSGRLGEFDINFQDGLGNTALHYAASTPSPTALEYLLDNEAVSESIDLNAKNRLQKATPLHLAVQLENEQARLGVVEMLLDAGADPREKDKDNEAPLGYLHPEENDTDKEIKKLIYLSLAHFTLGDNRDDIADDDDDDDDGSASDSD